MATYVHAVATASIASGPTSYDVTLPTGYIADDVLLLGVTHEKTGAGKPTVTGWTKIVDAIDSTEGTASNGRYLTIWQRTATGSEGTTVTVSLPAAGTARGSTVAIRGANPASAELNTVAQTTAAATLPMPTYDADGPGMQVAFGYVFKTGIGWTNATARITAGAGPYIATDAIAAAGDTAPPPTLTYASSAKGMGAVIGFTDTNLAPNAPTITSLTGGVSIDRAAVNRASWTFSDPNPGDTQSKFDLRYKVVGAGSWTTITTVTPNQFHDFAASALAADDYEWQVRTYDALGLVGPYTSSSFFTAADAPDGPTITAPTNGATVDRFTTVTWSVPDQDEYQVRRVADDAGVPDTGTIYSDTGAVAVPAARSLELDFSVNNRAEHIQVRIEDAGLWSEWASIQVNVSYDPPPVPTLDIETDPDLGRLLVEIGNPAPGAGEEPTDSNNVWVDDGDGFERRATGLTPNTTWVYWTPVSGRDYLTNLYVEAVAANGATTPS